MNRNEATVPVRIELLAVLTTRLRSDSVEAHISAGHRASPWASCNLLPCAADREWIDEARGSLPPGEAEPAWVAGAPECGEGIAGGWCARPPGHPGRCNSTRRLWNRRDRTCR